MTRRAAMEFALMLLLLVVVVAVAGTVGAAPARWSTALRQPASLDGEIIFAVRLPRICLALIAGAALSLAGVALQALLRNPLAEPFTLGVSSGAAVGAFAALHLGLESWLPGIGAVTLCSFATALLTILLVFALARRAAGGAGAMLLAGVTLSYVFGALILALHFLSDFGQSYRFLRWLMGSLDTTGYPVVLSILPLTLVGAGFLIATARDLDLIAAGEDFAAARGTDVGALQRRVFFAASTLTGAVVAAVGPIGFVGLIVPHILRPIVGNRHGRLIPASLLVGASFLIACDTVARTVLAPREVPVGVVTALLGGPFFLSLLRRGAPGTGRGWP